MNNLDSDIRAFGGGRLIGDSLVRFAHLDEAGTTKKDNFCVVAGVVSHADRQWRQLNQYLAELRKEFVPADCQKPVVFHATDIFHGSGKFSRETWPREKRMELLGCLADIPVKFSLPVICGPVDKSNHTWGDTKPGSNSWEANNYSLAFGLCVAHFEFVLRDMCEPHEVGTVIAEDVPHMRSYAKLGYKILADPEHVWDQADNVKNYMPFERVVEHPLFAQKDESAILQIADAIAFLMGRRMNGNNDVSPLISRFSSQIAIFPHQMA